MQSHFVNKSVASLLGCAFAVYSFTATESVNAADYARWQENIQNNTNYIETIESNEGRYSRQLLEPLEQLALAQLQANQFDAATKSLDQAIQIARISDGLYTREQYRLLQLEIEISRSRKDWESTIEKLAHFAYLIESKYEGSNRDKLLKLNWLANKHLQYALESTSEHRANFLIKATVFSEYAVQFAQVSLQTEDELYPGLLHDLSNKYYVETRGILGDKDSSYLLRTVDSQRGIIEEKASAIERRYLAGLEKLQMLRDNLATSAEVDLQALAMAEIYIADWKLAFNEYGTVADEYRAATALLLEAGISRAELDRFFAQPVTIPRNEFLLSFSDALAAVEKTYGSKSAPVAVVGQYSTEHQPLFQMTLMENSDRLPGLVSDQFTNLSPAAELNTMYTDSSDYWATVSLRVAIDPKTGSKFSSRGYSIRSKLIPTVLTVDHPSSLNDRGLRMVLDRVRSVSFRPAFQDGDPIAATFSINYNYRSGASTPLSGLLGAL